jgi:polysaccharide biosynthesis transport protein
MDQLSRPAVVPVPYKELPAGYSGYNGYAPQQEMDAHEGPGLIEYWRILNRRKGTVILIAFVGLALGVLVTLPQTPVYQAKAVLEVQNVNDNFMNMKESSPEAQSYNALTDIQTQIKILQSETLKERTVAKLKLTGPEDLKPQQSRPSAWRKALNLPEPEPVDAQEALLKGMAANMKIRAAGQTRIIEVTVDSTDRELAASFANTLTNEFIDQNMEARWKMSQRTGDWLSRQLDDMRIKLERSEDALQRYAREAGLLFMGNTGNDRDSARTNISEEKLRQVQQSLSTATTERVSKQSRYEMAASSPPEALPDVLNDSTLRDYQQNLTDLRRQLAEASSTYTAEYPKVKRLQAQVETVEAAQERERDAIINRIKNEYNEAVRREKLLTADYMNQARTVTGEGEKSIHYNILKREVDSNRQLV